MKISSMHNPCFISHSPFSTMILRLTHDVLTTISLLAGTENSAFIPEVSDFQVVKFNYDEIVVCGK